MNSINIIADKIDRLNQDVLLGIEYNAFYKSINDNRFIDLLNEERLGGVYDALDRTLLSSIILAISRICDCSQANRSSIQQLIKDLDNSQLLNSIKSEHSKEPKKALSRLKGNVKSLLDNGSISEAGARKIIDEQEKRVEEEINNLPSIIEKLKTQWKNFERKFQKELLSVKNLRHDYICHSLVYKKELEKDKYRLIRKNINDLIHEIKNIVKLPYYIVNGSEIFYDVFEEQCNEHFKSFIALYT